MSVLAEGFPAEVWVAGRRHALDTDYRTALRVLAAFEDPALTGVERQLVMLGLLYRRMPRDLGAAAAQGAWFLNCGEQSLAAPGGPRLYSFEKDGPYIVSAMQQTHGIDLSGGEGMHWWRFVYLFMDLSEHCFFSRLVQLRRRQARGALSAQERAWAREMAHLVDLPQIRSPREQAAAQAFLERLGGNREGGGADRAAQAPCAQGGEEQSCRQSTDR